MIVDSKNIEFGYELISVLPYAYYLHSKGKLKKTISGNDTECLYYFSPNHKINTSIRSWYNTPKVKTPNIRIHKPFLDKTKFLPPPLKEQYKNRKFKFKKETIVICNRYNIEWSKRPINYFDLNTLEKLFKKLQDKYQVVYINIDGRKELYDNAPPIKLGDYELLKKYPKVINIHDIKTDLSFNTLQLKIFANCKKYITLNGGHAILAAYFGGENIVMSKYGKPQAKEISKTVNSFYRWYNEFSGQRVVHVSNETKLLNQVTSQWINKDPIINILVRTSDRPNYFKNCIKSITDQTYKNINIFVSIDNKNRYTIPYPVYPLRVEKTNNIQAIENVEGYGVPFPSNLYLNALQKEVKEGIIMYLDDDDMLSNTTSLQDIAKEFKKNDLVFWRVKIDQRIHPSDENWGKAPVVCDISGIGFAFDVKYKDIAAWTSYKQGDFRVSEELYNKIDKKFYLDKVLTETQTGHGMGQKIDLKTIAMKKKKVKEFKVISKPKGLSKARVIDSIILQQSDKIGKDEAHFVILIDGAIVKGVDTSKAGNHCESEDANSIGIILEGDSFNIPQQKALMNVLHGCMGKKELPVKSYDTFYPGKVNPNLNIRSLLNKFKLNYR